MRVSIAALSASLVLLAAAGEGGAQTPPGAAPGGAVPAGPGRITGQVTAGDGQPLQTAAITVRSAADSVVVSGALTDATGRFRVDGLAPGRYLLRVSLLGYLSRNSEEITLTLQAPVAELGVIALETGAVELDALEASAERQAVVIEADRTTYSARAMPVASSGTAADVLRAVPELEVDVSDNVRMRGNQAVAIHINGRPAPLRGEQLANFLRQLPGNRVDRVEVMPNPSAKHDPEGMGGIVNIVLRDDLDLGLSGSLSVSGSTRNRRFGNGRLNYQRGRLTLFTGAGLNDWHNMQSHYDLRRNLVTTPITSIEQNSWIDNRARGWNADWTAELRAGRQATLWTNAWMYAANTRTTGVTSYGILDDARAVLEHYDRDNASEFGWGNYNIGAGFKQVFQQQKEELTIDGRAVFGANDTHTRQTRLLHVLDGRAVETPPELLLNEIDGGNDNLTLQADYFRPLGRGRMDVGYRISRRTQENDNQLTTFAHEHAPDPTEQLHASYEYAEVFHSVYTTLGRPLGRFNVQAGLRGEITSTTLDSRVEDTSFSRQYTSLFPSLNVAFTPKPGRTARFLYSRRINRPSAWHLDPFVPSTDPLNLFVGNPELRPTFTESFTLDFSYSGRHGTLRVAPYFRHTSGVWERIRTVAEDGVSTSRWENARWSRAYGSNLTMSLSPTGRASGSATVNLYRDVRDGTNLSDAYQRAAVMWSLSGNMGFKVSESLRGQVFANHFPTQSILQGRASGYTFTSAVLRQEVWGKRGSVTLNVMDPLNLMGYSSRSSDSTYEQQSRSTQRARMGSVGFTYNFGKPPQQQSRRAGPEEATGETIRVR